MLLVQALEALAEAFGLSYLLFEIVPLLPPLQVLTFINFVAVLPFFFYLVSVRVDHYVAQAVRHRLESKLTNQVKLSTLRFVIGRMLKTVT